MLLTENRQILNGEQCLESRAPQGALAIGTFSMPLGGGSVSVRGSTPFFMRGGGKAGTA